jgi:hypothetical protein
MRFKPFELERYFAKYEFSAKYLLSSSDCDGLLQSDVLDLADAQSRELWAIHFSRMKLPKCIKA